MLPIGDENRGKRGLAVVTIGLVIVNVLVFLYENTLDLPELTRFIQTYGMISAEIQRGHDYTTLLTSMFVHGGFAHVAGNMLFLWIFGDNIEQRLGHVLSALFYLGCGLAASAAHILIDPHSAIPTVGASGAISGVMGAYILLYPMNRVRVIVWYIGIVPVPAFVFLGVWFLMQLFSGTMALNVETAQGGGVAFWAHIGGFVAGAAGALVLGAIRPEPPRERAEFALWQDRDLR
jgi:membrane associated rhomboid family serine protease